MKLPIITLITASDLIKPETLEIFINDYKAMLKKLKIKKIPLIVNSSKDIALFSRNIDEAIHPIFIISCKNGNGMDFLTDFLYLLPSSKEKISFKLKTDVVFDIHEHFVNSDKKIIVAGILSKGKLSLGQKCYLGPDKAGNYTLIEIEGLHCKKIPTKNLMQGQFSTVCISSNILI